MKEFNGVLKALVRWPTWCSVVAELYLLFNAPKIQMPSRLSSEVLKEMRGEMMAKPSQVGPHQV